MLSYVQVFVSLWTIVCQAPLSMGFFRQEWLERFAISSSRGFSQPRDRTHVSLSPEWQSDSLPSEPSGNLEFYINEIIQYMLIDRDLVSFIWDDYFEIHPCCASFTGCQVIIHYRNIVICLSIHLLMNIWMFLVWGYYRLSCYEHLCASLFVDLSFWFLKVRCRATLVARW